MRRNFLLTIALAFAGLVAVAGTAGAQGGLIDVSESGVGINLPAGEDLAPLGELPECANLDDDDGDGRTDLADADCTGPLDNSEVGEAAPPVPEPEPEPEPEIPPGPGTGPGSGDPGSGGNGGTGSGTSGGNGGNGGQDSSGGNGGQDSSGGDRGAVDRPANRNPDGSPTDTNPTLTVADFGPAPMGVPNFVIDQFSIPPFLLPIYQACGTEYGIPWQVLASINRIETAFGTNLNVSTAGALGWMQFMPATWEAYGVDANSDGRKDPYNPVDAICAAARYLNASGGEEDLRTAIFAYNHADWYVDEVLLYARQYGELPDDLVGSLTGLTEGARFPVAADARYADDISEREAQKRSAPRNGVTGNAADVVSTSATRRGINIYSQQGAPVVAVNDGVIREVGETKKLGKYIVLQDSYGNRFTYAELGRVSEVYPVPKEKKLTADDFRLVSPGKDEKPSAPASDAARDEQVLAAASDAGRSEPAGREQAEQSQLGPLNTEDMRQRLYAFPERPKNVGRADVTGQLDDLLADRFPGYESFKSYLGGVMKFDSDTMEMEALREGSQVVAGTVLGRIGDGGETADHVNFAIQPAGRGAPKVDPKPILDGWKLLEATAIYRAAGKNPFEGTAVSVGQILLMSKEQLERRVLANPRLELAACDREYVAGGQIDRRLMAIMEYLTARGYRLTITSMLCGRETSITSSGNVSHHSFGSAVDIAAINGQPVLGNQGPGTLSYSLVRDVLQLQGTMLPDQVITLMDLGGPSFAMSDHHDHVHIGYAPATGPGSDPDKQFVQLLKPDQWERLIGRIAEIDNPEVRTGPSKFSLPSNKGEHRASAAHVGE
jgi:murein DD-endopeptidase MepM/ murein hydrolase activator NlpD